MQHSKQIRMRQEPCRLHRELMTQKTADGHASCAMRTIALVLLIVPPLNSTTPSPIMTTPPYCAEPSHNRRCHRGASAPARIAVRPCAHMMLNDIQTHSDPSGSLSKPLAKPMANPTISNYPPIVGNPEPRTPVWVPAATPIPTAFGPTMGHTTMRRAA